jgi:hypothetical protein
MHEETPRNGGKVDEGDDGSGTSGAPGSAGRGDEAREHHNGAPLPRAEGSLKGESKTTEIPNWSGVKRIERLTDDSKGHPIPKDRGIKLNKFTVREIRHLRDARDADEKEGIPAAS